MDALIIVLLLTGLVFAAFGSWIATSKNRNSSEGALVGFLFGPLGCLIEAMLPTMTHEERRIHDAPDHARRYFVSSRYGYISQDEIHHWMCSSECQAWYKVFLRPNPDPDELRKCLDDYTARIEDEAAKAMAARHRAAVMAASQPQPIMPPLVDMTNWVEGVTEWFGAIPDWVQMVALGLFMGTAISILFVIAFF